MNAPCGERYPFVLRVLHWLLALLLAVQVALGFVAEHWASPALSKALFPPHFRLGVLILCLMVLRLGMRLLLPLPTRDSRPGRWQRRVRSWAHGLFYLLVIALPVSGHVIWVWMGADRTLFGGIEVPALFVPPQDETGRAIAWYVHVCGAWVLLALTSLHVAAAVRGQYAHRLIARRMGFSRRPCGSDPP